MIKNILPLHLQDEWHPTKNQHLETKEVSLGSHQKAWWRVWHEECGQFHEWEAPIRNRVKDNNSDPFLLGKKVLKGCNDFLSNFPDLAEEWNYAKNGLAPDEIYWSSRKKVWWKVWHEKCRQFHEWETNLSSRTRRKTGDPFLLSQKVLSGCNDLATVYPELAEQWHPTKNSDVKVYDVTIYSGKKVWWRVWHEECRQFHEWESVVSVRTSALKAGVKIPFKRKVFKGCNDFGSRMPELVGEWHPTKNLGLTPDMFSYGSDKKIWWRCDKEHEWETSLYCRSYDNTGCPVCAVQFVSKGEVEVGEFIGSLGIDFEANVRSFKNISELDIYVPSLNIGVEYNGLYWHSERHKGKSFHYDKWLECEKQGIRLIHVWEDDWRDRKQVVQHMLRNVFGVYDESVSVQECKIVDVSYMQRKHFLNKHHIQGNGSGSVSVGLEHNGRLVAVMLFGKRSEGMWKLVRYATSCEIIDGFSQIVSVFCERYKPETLFCFSDNSWEDDDSYVNSGWVFDGDIGPCYMYVVNNERKHTSFYKKKVFENDPNLLWESGLSVYRLSELNNINKIWDAGKKHWIFNRLQ